MNLAVLTGSNAATNNYLNHRQLTSLDKALKDCDAKKCSQTDREKILIEYANESKKNDAALAACTTQACVDFHKNEIAEASKIERNVLFNIDGKLGNELRGRQVKVEALKTQYEKVQFYENEAKEFANFYKAKCATGSMSDCVQAYTNMKTGNIQALKDLKGSAKEFWGSFADDPNQNAAKTFIAVTGLTLAELLPTHTAEIAALLPYGTLAKGLGLGAPKTGDLLLNAVGPLRPSARPLLPNEGVLVDASLGLQSKKSGLFSDVIVGEYPAASTKYLYTVDDRGINIILESTPFPTPRGNVVHTNISERASIGGEVWFGPDKTVTINAGSGRFGDAAGVTPIQWRATVKYWESLGYKVNPIPYGSR